MKKLRPYSTEIEEQMGSLYHSLSEKDRRRYAAIEAKKLGYGGVSYVCRLFGCAESSVNHGLKELAQPQLDQDKRLRKAGGGRKRKVDTLPGLEEAFLAVMDPHTAGSPMDETVKWSNLSRPVIAEKLAEKGFVVSVTVVDQLLETHNFRRRQAFKSEAGKQVAHRDEQFKNIEKLIKAAHEKGNPVMSMDVKKKELIGNFYRAGVLYTQERVQVNDHDFRSLAEGLVIPHALYDLGRNRGYVTLGTSHDTTEFACTCIRRWWLDYGRLAYPEATEILLLCDCGGSNNARYYIFKQDLQHLANELGIAIRIAHYPPYTSKYNPIEHRLFPHLTRACQGVVFKSYDLVKEFMSQAKTRTGLKVFVSILDQVFQTKRKVEDGFKENMPIVFDDYLPQWNYTAFPALPNVSGSI